MATTSVPSLSTLGFISDLSGKLDILLSHFFLSDYNQTFFYKEFVTSLPRIIEKNGSNIKGVASDLERGLQTYFLRYFTTADVNVSYPTDIEDPSGKVEMTVNIGVNDQGEIGNFSRLLQTANGRLMAIEKLNNYP